MNQDDKLPSRAAMTHESIRGEGVQELKRDGFALLLSAIAAGLSMGMSFLVKAKLQSIFIRNPLIDNLGYTVGFIIVILSRQQLFTENTLTAVLPILHKKSWRNVISLFRLWGIVLVGNLIGTALISLIFYYWPVFDKVMQQNFYLLAKDLFDQNILNLFLGSIISGWLIATMVWMFPAAGNAKIVVIFLMTYLVAICDFPHVIIASIELFYLVFSHRIFWSAFFYPFGLAILIGNILGGTFIFALLSHLQIRNDMKNIN